MKNSEIHRNRNKKKSVFGKFLRVIIIVCIIALAGIGAGLAFSLRGLPDVESNMTPNISSRIYDVKGRLIATVHAEENRIPVPITEVPENLQNAFIAAEDVRFYEHHGIDPRGILRALFSNIIHGQATGQGGSTLTQQLARNAFLSQEQTIKRKILEVFLAFEIESKYDKQKILEMYMNQIYFGQGCYGIETASKVYFGKDAKDLTLAQCAMLAGLPNSPNYYSPFRSLEAAKSRQAVVLDQMAKYGYITEEQAEAAKVADVGLMKPSKVKSDVNKAPYFVNYVIQEISDKYDSEAIYKEGLQIYTTLDLDMQEAAESAVRNDLPPGAKDKNGVSQPQAALLSLEVGTGYVKAMVGGRGEDHFNRAVQMIRQPGSAFKPFVYAAALDSGLSPSTTLSNEKKEYAGGWIPKNYGGTYGGKVSMTEALVHSMNVPTIDLANKVGMSKILKLAESCGISTLVKDGKYSDNNLAASIGGLTNGVSVIDMAKAYSVFANDGVLVEPRAIIKVVDKNGNTLEDHSEKPQGKHVLDQTTADKLTSMLEQVITKGTGGGAYIGGAAAGKTGTTDDEHDAWFAGYTPHLSTVVWIGDDTSTNAGYTGGTIPAVIWKDYMRVAEGIYPSNGFEISDNIRQQTQYMSQKEKDEKEKKEKEEKDKKQKLQQTADKAKSNVKQAGEKLLDRIAGKDSQEDSE